MAREKHGERNTKLYSVWSSMKTRCNNPNDKEHKNYGGRGIKVCKEWEESFSKFSEWAKHNGYKEGLTIERINVNGNYCPENCTWITIEEQARNRTNTRWVEYNGKTMSLAEACEIFGVPQGTVRRRLEDGWSIDDALSVSPIYPIKSELRIMAERAGINYHTVRSRIEMMGWSVEKALNTPSKVRKEPYFGENRKCLLCGETYEVKSPNQIYCSSKCCFKAKRIRNKKRKSM